MLSELNCALHAHVLLRRDVDYIVRNGRIEMVDEHTGRVVQDRHWPDGLQAALEAKEGLERRADGRILGSLTLQKFLRGYSRLCGMTGTARDAARELSHTHGLDVLVIPTHHPVARVDQPDTRFTHRAAKERAIIAEVQHAHASGRPVLVGTVSVIESERLAEQLRRVGLPCQVLNAKHDAEEAAVIARAGAVGSVTMSTNMAGRGTDIRLGDHSKPIGSVWLRWAGSMSSAPTGTRVAAWTCSCAAVRGGRAIRVSHDSSSASRTISSSATTSRA